MGEDGKEKQEKLEDGLAGRGGAIEQGRELEWRVLGEERGGKQAGELGEEPDEEQDGNQGEELRGGGLRSRERARARGGTR